MGVITVSDRKQLVELFNLTLSNYAVVKVVVVPHADLRLPSNTIESLNSSLHIVLEYGLNMPIPIDDLKVDTSGISATLSFARTPFNTFIPWEAVAGFAPDSSGKNNEEKKTHKKPKLSLVP